MEVVKALIARFYKHSINDSLYRNSIFLMSNTVALGVFSFAFWLLAARVYSTNDIGTASAVVATSTLLAYLSYSGFDFALIKFIPGSKRAHSRSSTGLTFAGLLATALSLIYLLLIPVLVPQFNFLTSSALWTIGFFVLVIATTWNTLTNSILIAHRITQYALIATLAMGLIRFPILYFLKSSGLAGLLTSYSLAIVTCVLLCFIFLYKSVGYKYRFYVSRHELSNMRSYAFNTYISNISGGLPALVLPTMILIMLNASSAAYFFIANQFAYLLYTIAGATAQSLFAEGAWEAKELNELLKKAAKLMCLLIVPGVLLMVTLGWFFLSLFGKEYASSGYWMLFFFSLAALPKIASYLFSTVLRLHNHVKAVIIVATIGTIIQLSASYIGMRLTDNLITLGIAALLCEIFVSVSYTVLFFHYRKANSLKASKLAS